MGVLGRFKGGARQRKYGVSQLQAESADRRGLLVRNEKVCGPGWVE